MDTHESASKSERESPLAALVSFILLCFHICNETRFLHFSKKSRVNSSSFAVLQSDLNNKPPLCDLEHIN